MRMCLYSAESVEGRFCELLRRNSLERSLHYGPTCFTYLLPRDYACLTPSYGGGCTLSMDHEIVGTIAKLRKESENSLS